MKIREICSRHGSTETEVEALLNPDIEALSTWLVENLFDVFHKRIVFTSPSPADEFELADDFEHRRRQRRRKHPFAAGPAEVNSPPQNDAAVAPAADAGTADAAAPMAMGGPTLG